MGIMGGGGGNNATQISYRWRNDDGPEVSEGDGGATWIAALNTPIDRVFNDPTVLRVRTCVHSAAETIAFRLERSVNLGSWFPVNTSDTRFQVAVSTEINDGDTTDFTGTDEDMSSANFADATNGALYEDPTVVTGNTTFASGLDKRMEVEVCIIPIWTGLAVGDSCRFRLTISGIIFTGGYLEHATMNIVASTRETRQVVAADANANAPTAKPTSDQTVAVITAAATADAPAVTRTPGGVTRSLTTATATSNAIAITVKNLNTLSVSTASAIGDVPAAARSPGGVTRQVTAADGSSDSVPLSNVSPGGVTRSVTDADSNADAPVVTRSSGVATRTVAVANSILDATPITISAGVKIVVIITASTNADAPTVAVIAIGTIDTIGVIEFESASLQNVCFQAESL